MAFIDSKAWQDKIDIVLQKHSIVMAAMHRSIKTEKSYAVWVKSYLQWLYHNQQGTSESKVNAFLTHLAVDRKVSVSTQTQALNAIVYLYRYVFEKPLGDIGEFKPARVPKKLPVVLSRNEVTRIRNHLHGVHWLIVSLLYGSGLRLNECLSLRIQDIDFDRHQIMVRNGKGAKDRTVQLPAPTIEPLKNQIETARRNHRIDLAHGFGSVYLPHALEKKFKSAAKDFKWQFIFQASKVGPCPRTGEIRRHHLHDTAVSKAIRRAVKLARISKRVSAHTFRHSYATHLLESGVNLRTIQELLGHADIRTTEIYTHVAQNAATSIPSPLELPDNVTPIARAG